MTDTAQKRKIWSPLDVTKFVTAADQYGAFSIGTAVLLNEWMGQRAKDIITVRTNAYQNGEIIIQQSKTGAEVTLPVDDIPHLIARSEGRHIQPKKDTIQ